MAAAITDLLKKYKSLFSTTLSVGIGTGTSDTITPASVSGLPTDTLITLTFDRVDSGGVATPTKLERIQGIISGGNFVSYTRGIDGTTEQAHAGGAVIEMIWNADDWNDLVTWGLVEHNQLGGHTNITASNITASGVSTLTSLTSPSIYKSTIKSSVSEVVTTAGGTTTYTLTPSVAIASYATGQEFTILMNATNTGASTINISGLGAKSLTKGGATALSSGDLLINAEYKIIYDGTQFQVIGISSAGSTAATRAEVATGTSNTVFNTPQNTHEFHVPPQGFLYNGKIVPSVASNNLTVALKGLDGNDPSATNPVYVRIGDTVRSITAALSVTKNAGTNWFGSGATGLATLEIDYFVYLGYNATDGVTIGFARIPLARKYSDFSATTTNEKYCAISTITTAAATDNYEMIGWFGATLSATAAFTWSVPTFTPDNLSQKPTLGRWLVYTPTATAGASMTYTSTAFTCYYKALDKDTFAYDIYMTGTVGGTPAPNIGITLPFTPRAIYTLGSALTYATGTTVYSATGSNFASNTSLDLYKYDRSNLTAGNGNFQGMIWVRISP